MFCDTINRNHIIKKVVFDNNGKWQLFIGQYEIPLNEYCIEDAYDLCRFSIHSVCSIVFKLRLCKGKLKAGAEITLYKKCIFGAFWGGQK